MITPAEIQNKEFTKSLRGYSEEEVDMFLDVITLDLEKLIKENINLKAQVAKLEKEKGDIDGTDISIRETLETAKALMDDISKSAEKRAKNLIRNAEMDAAIIIKDAKTQADDLVRSNEQLISDYTNFKDEYKTMLERELYKVENNNIEIKNVNEDKLGALFAKEEVVVNEDIPNENNIDDRKTRVNIKYD